MRTRSRDSISPRFPNQHENECSAALGGGCGSSGSCSQWTRGLESCTARAEDTTGFESIRVRDSNCERHLLTLMRRPIDGAKRKEILYGPWPVNAMQMIHPQAFFAESPCANCYVTAMQATIKYGSCLMSRYRVITGVDTSMAPKPPHHRASTFTMPSSRTQIHLGKVDSGPLAMNGLLCD
jgi:hypothetical protein